MDDEELGGESSDVDDEEADSEDNDGESDVDDEEGDSEGVDAELLTKLNQALGKAAVNGNSQHKGDEESGSEVELNNLRKTSKVAYFPVKYCNFWYKIVQFFQFSY